MKPTLGRIVHVKTLDGDVRAAIIAFIHEGGNMALTVFSADGSGETFPLLSKIDSMAAGPKEAQPGQWWWPERL